ncbi:hypothetical protein I5I61_31550 [Pseudomonas nitroreducens]|uniref:Uncharacterized protein n=1 Tax=Pseudomonas nitroreducens TaxID=46680 RepID=A0ABS0KVD6_PSENT|nr:hypothetical protein [Pseudomonas nitroreducens]MBG6292009.1 hypothetical protein [Pseudomonas nitroreducens]
MDRILIVLRAGLGLNFEAMRPALQVGAPIAIGRGGAVIADVLDDFPAAHSLRLKEVRTQLGNEGHGHVIPRLDGTVMRCGGPNICKTCQKERLLLDIWQEAEETLAATTRPGIFDVITGTAGQAAPVPQVLPSSEEHAAQIEQVAAGLREDQAELAKSILVLGDWLERVEIEDGYVGVPVIEAVEVVVTELKRQQKTAAPVVCRYGHWFAGDSDEATLIRERGICSDCAAVDDSWLGAQEPEGGGA